MPCPCAFEAYTEIGQLQLINEIIEVEQITHIHFILSGICDFTECVSTTVKKCTTLHNSQSSVCSTLHSKKSKQNKLRVTLKKIGTLDSTQ